MAGAIARVEDPAQRATLATKVFGRSAGVELAPLLQLGEEGMAKLRSEAQELGLVMSTESAVAADELGDAFDRAKQQLGRMAQEIGVAVAGPLLGFLEWTKTWLGDAIRWTESNKELVVTIAEVTGGVAGLSAGAIVLGKVVTGVTAIMKVANLALIGFGKILTLISLHPIIAFLTLVAAGVLALKWYFSDTTDEATKMVDALDKVEKTTPSQPNVDAIAGQARKIQTQLQASVAASPAAPVPTSMLAGLDRMFLESSLQIEKWTHETAENTKQMLNLMRTGDAGFYAGTG